MGEGIRDALEAVVNDRHPRWPIKRVEFFIDGTSVGSSAIDSNGLASLSVANNRAAGSYNVTATFTPTGPAGVSSSSAGPKTLAVTKENATATYTGDQFVTTAGPNFNTASVVLAANLVQEGADAEHIWGLDDHWSSGGGIGFSTSEYSNLDGQTYVYAALEYNIVPNKESTRRLAQLRVLFLEVYADYIDETIFGKHNHLAIAGDDDDGGRP